MSMKTWGGYRPGAGRKKGIKRIPVCYTINEETKKDIDSLSVSLGLSKGEVVDIAIRTIKELD